jgi:hypothetical protein
MAGGLSKGRMKQERVAKTSGAAGKSPKDLTSYRAFGMWADREDMKDVHAWLRKTRTPRYLKDGGSLFSPPKKRRHRKRKS